MMIAAVELLAKIPNPTVAQIKDAFTNKPPSPHLCRCGTYAAIIDAVQRAAKTMQGGKGVNPMPPRIDARSNSPVMPFTSNITRRGFVKMGGALFVWLSIPAGSYLNAAES